MPTTKTKNLEQVARWFHALSDETRLQIIECVLDCEQCVCDLTEVLHTGQSRLSFHLKTLKDAGLLTDRRDGRWVYYSLNPDVIEELQDFMQTMKTRSKQSCAKSRCG